MIIYDEIKRKSVQKNMHTSKTYIFSHFLNKQAILNVQNSPNHVWKQLFTYLGRFRTQVSLICLIIIAIIIYLAARGVLALA